MIPHQPSIDLAVLGLVVDEPHAIRLTCPTLIVTIESSIASARARGWTGTLDRSNYLVAPRGSVVTLEAVGMASRIAVLALSERVQAMLARDYEKLGFDRARLTRWLRASAVLPRTVWIHELVHRYVFERHALGEHGTLAVQFLEVELAKELYFALRDRDLGAERSTTVRAYSPPVERALRHIEANLFDDCNVALLARLGGASSSTLLRLFRTEVGCAPGAYWRHRKLDEALIALRSGRSVADVATLVGYENPTAFGFAFRGRFGRPPSAFRPTGRVRRAP